MTSAEQGTQKAVLDILTEHEQRIKRLEQQLNAALDRIATLNGKVERLKGTHGF